MQVQSDVHLIGGPVHIGIESLECLLDRQQEYEVDKDDAVDTDEVEHLHGLGKAGVVALRLPVHLLDQHVAPHVQGQHARHQHKRVE